MFTERNESEIETMSKVVVIKFQMLYEPEPDIEGIAANMEIAKKHVEELKRKWPHLYPHGEFIFEEYEMIME